MIEEKELTSDELALQRTFMAAQRTFMAWTRTAISMISFGFAIPKFLEYVENARHQALAEFTTRAIGAGLIFLGVFVLLVSAYEHGTLARDMRRQHEHLKFPSSRLSYFVAVVLVVLGILALLNITLNVGAF